MINTATILNITIRVYEIQKEMEVVEFGIIEKYYKTAPKIVSKINPNFQSIYSKIWSNYLRECLSMIESGNNSRCREIYINMMQELQHRFM